MHSVIVAAPAPYKFVVLNHPSSVCSTQDIYNALTHLLPSTLLDSCRLEPTFRHGDAHFALCPRVLGGKGGFGSQLRAAGSRKSSSKTDTRAAMKDVSGRRLRTLEKAEALALALRDLPAREKAARTEKKEALERLLSKELVVDKFDDEAYFDDCEEMLKDIKFAMQESLEHISEDNEQASNEEVGQSTISKPRRLQGWDADEDHEGESSDEESLKEDEQDIVKDGKGKAVASPPSKRASKRRKV